MSNNLIEERERERERQTDRETETDRDRDRQTERQRETDRQRDREIMNESTSSSRLKVYGSIICAGVWGLDDVCQFVCECS